MLLLAICAPAFAATWTVDPSGGGDFASLESAVLAAVSGDVLSLAPGTYGDVSLHDTTLVIAAQIEGTASLLGLNIDGGDITVQGVRFVDSFEPVTVRAGSLTLSRSEIVGGGGEVGVRAIEGAELTLDRFSMAQFQALLAPVVAQGSTVHLHDAHFTGNSGEAAGAILVEDGFIDVAGSSFTANVADDGAGAVAIAVGTLVANQVDFSGNIGTEGGALSVVDALASLSDNLADGYRCVAPHIGQGLRSVPWSA